MRLSLLNSTEANLYESTQSRKTQTREDKWQVTLQVRVQMFQALTISSKQESITFH